MLDLKRVIWRHRQSGETVQIVKIEDEVSYIDFDTSMTQELTVDEFAHNYEVVGELI